MGEVRNHPTTSPVTSPRPPPLFLRSRIMPSVSPNTSMAAAKSLPSWVPQKHGK